MYQKSLYWMRRDLRLDDNRALFEACLLSRQVIPVFVFDTNILSQLKSEDDKRVTFIYESLMQLKKDLEKQNSHLILLHGDPEIEIPKLAHSLGVQCVFFNKDYEPYAKIRDARVVNKLTEHNIKSLSYKDSVVFEEAEILNGLGQPYKVFTPYMYAWNKKLNPHDLNSYQPNLKNLAQKSEMTINGMQIADTFLTLEKLGFKKADLILKAGTLGALEKLKIFTNKIKQYHEDRNYVNLEGTSTISTYLRFGLVSIRELFRFANKHDNQGADTWKKELIWREFYQMILSQFPYVVKGPFKKEYNSLVWEGNKKHFDKWCQGQTGYPIIDAAMRAFNETGWMHNRLRMVVASFLTKDLLLNYQLGEGYFAQKLLDFELASNNGGWQWCASTGCDAQPYFRVFNPETQSKNFDPQGDFIKKYCPELKLFSEKEIHAPHKTKIAVQQKAGCIIGEDYPFPIVNHQEQRLKAVAMFNAL